MLATVAAACAREYDSPSEWTKPLADGTCREGRELREMDCMFDRSHTCNKYYSAHYMPGCGRRRDGCVCFDVELDDGTCGGYSACMKQRLLDL